MKNKATQTQMESWELMQPKLNKRQSQIIGAMKALGRKATNRQLAKFLGWEINRITPRVNELVAQRIVKPGNAVRDTETNRRVIEWLLPATFQQLSIGYER